MENSFLTSKRSRFFETIVIEVETERYEEIENLLALERRVFADSSREDEDVETAKRHLFNTLTFKVKTLVVRFSGLIKL